MLSSPSSNARVQPIAHRHNGRHAPSQLAKPLQCDPYHQMTMFSPRRHNVREDDQPILFPELARYAALYAAAMQLQAPPRSSPFRRPMRGNARQLRYWRSDLVRQIAGLILTSHLPPPWRANAACRSAMTGPMAKRPPMTRQAQPLPVPAPFPGYEPIANIRIERRRFREWQQPDTAMLGQFRKTQNRQSCRPLPSPPAFRSLLQLVFHYRGGEYNKDRHNPAPAVQARRQVRPEDRQGYCRNSGVLFPYQRRCQPWWQCEKAWSFARPAWPENGQLHFRSTRRHKHWRCRCD